MVSALLPYRVARQTGVAKVPVQQGWGLLLRSGGDTGLPVVLGDPADPAALAIQAIADTLATRGRGLAGLSLGISPR